MQNNIYKNNNKRKLPITPISQSDTKKKFPINILNNNEHMIFSYKYFKCKSLKNSEFNNLFK